MTLNRHVQAWMMILCVVVLFSMTAFSADTPQAQTTAAPDSPRGKDTSPTAKETDVEQKEQKADQSHAARQIAAATRGVIGSKHDFSSHTGRAGDACSACHVPHIQAVQSQEGSGESFALAFYRMGGQRDVLVTDRYMPGPASLNCLSCHNGAVAPSTVGSSHVVLSAHREGFQVGDFSTRDHPIGVDYPERMAGYRSRAALLADGRVPIPQGRVECVSCHDPHNRSGVEKMLVMSNTRSALCLACHEK